MILDHSSSDCHRYDTIPLGERPICTVANVRIGVRLPGPLRASWSPGQRVQLGANLGPLSVSTSGGKARPAGAPTPDLVLPGTLADGVAWAGRQGYAVDSHGPGWVVVAKGWQAAELRQLPQGVAARGVLSPRTQVALALAGVAALGLLVVACCMGGR